MTAITVPQGLEYVGAALLSTVFVLAGQNVLVGRYRKRAGISYPQLYAEQSQVQNSKDALLFNCAQRAHQNTLENIPIIYVTTLLTGLKFPILAATGCGLWSLARIPYTRGYITGDPAKRISPPYYLGTLGSIGLIVGSVYAVASLIFGI